MAGWTWCWMAGIAPARAPLPSISPNRTGASSRQAPSRRRQSRSAWNPRTYPSEIGPAPMKYLRILLAGGVGSLARYFASSASPGRFGTRFPTGTMVVNVTGCFLIGLIMTLLTERPPHPYGRLVLVVGVLGGHT